MSAKTIRGAWRADRFPPLVSDILMRSKEKGIAIIGAGLAGLTAAHFLKKWRSTLPITIFEESGRIGGRLYTSRKPPGEHGARYLLGSELDVKPGGEYWRDYSLPDGTTIGELFEDSGLHLSPMGKDWPHCCVLNPLTFKRLTPSGRYLKSHFPGASRIIRRLKSLSRAEEGTFADWLKENLFKDQRNVQDSLKVIKMVLAGETCAPWSHLSAQYALECLASAVTTEKWFMVKGGSEHLIAELSRPIATRIKRNNDCLKVRNSRRNCVAVWHRTANETRTSYFQGAIISSPNGDALVGRNSTWPKRHFHSYISVLYDSSVRPTLKGNRGVDLRDGLYTDDSFVNYLELESKNHRWVLRILAPDARRFEHWRDRQISNHCRKILAKVGVAEDWAGPPSIRRWENGLPCGGTNKKFDKVSDGLYLCGDRYGRWPSMAVAIVSGARAADALLNDLEL
jgi:hypothetical protein